MEAGKHYQHQIRQPSMPAPHESAPLNPPSVGQSMLCAEGSAPDIRRLCRQAPDPEKVMTPDDELYRRSILARSRNYLLSYALRDQEWVLWMDVDIVWVRKHCSETRSFAATTLPCTQTRLMPSVKASDTCQTVHLTAFTIKQLGCMRIIRASGIFEHIDGAPVTL